MQNFRSLGPIFLVEVEFEVGGGVSVNSNNHVKPNLRLWLGWGFDNIECNLVTGRTLSTEALLDFAFRPL